MFEAGDVGRFGSAEFVVTMPLRKFHKNVHNTASV
jgi:hypothetical protein